MLLTRGAALVLVLALAATGAHALSIFRGAGGVGGAPPLTSNNKGVEAFNATPYFSCDTGDSSTWSYNANGGTTPPYVCPKVMLQTSIQDEMSAWRSLGIGWYRLPAYQTGIDQSCSGSINWGKTTGQAPFNGIGWNTLIADLQSLSIKPLIMIGETASCANGGVGNGWIAPSSPSGWVNEYVAAVVTHLSSLGVHDYEVWNEANGNWSWNGNTPSASFYTTLLCDAYAKIHAIDPQANVMAQLSGTAGSTILPTTFLSSIYSDSGQNCFDNLSNHPYAFNGPTSSYLRTGSSGTNWDLMTGQDSTSPSLVSIMAANGDSAKKIYLTEFGCSDDAGSIGAKSYAYCGGTSTKPSPGGGINQQQQMIYDAVTGAGRFPQQGPTIWFQEHDIDPSIDACNSASDGDPDDHCTGLYTNAFGAKAAAATFAAQSGQW